MGLYKLSLPYFKDNFLQKLFSGPQNENKGRDPPTKKLTCQSHYRTNVCDNFEEDQSKIAASKAQILIHKCTVI